MTLMIDPEAVESFLTCKVKATAAIADPLAPKLSTEVNAAGALDLSLFLRMWNPEITTNTGTAPTKMARGIDLPREGKTQYAGIEIRYPHRPQDAATTDGNKAFNLLKQGTQLFFVVRKGILVDVAFAVGDKVEVWAIKCGRQRRVPSGDDEFAEWEIAQMVFPRRQVVEDAVLAA